MAAWDGVEAWRETGRSCLLLLLLLLLLGAARLRLRLDCCLGSWRLRPAPWGCLILRSSLGMEKGSGGEEAGAVTSLGGGCRLGGIARLRSLVFISSAAEGWVGVGVGVDPPGLLSHVSLVPGSTRDVSPPGSWRARGGAPAPGRGEDE